MTAVSTDISVSPITIGPTGRRPRWQRVIRGGETDPAWVRPSLLALLVGTALLYIWGLGASGWANTFYSAAVQAGTKSWRAMFFGSFDSSNFIAVDKPPASLWVMEISARLFGVNSWSILVPQALEGVAAVGLLYATVRRHFSASAGLIAGLVLATTPVATLMFRFNNPDALLVLLLVAAAYATTRALESTKTRWLVVAGALVGFGFLTKMLQAFLVVPGFGVVYLIYAKTTLRRRIMQLAAAGAAIVVSAGWWVAAVAWTPASSRPYVGGSTDNSILQLIFGYNGFGRLTGNETGSVGGGGQGGTGMWGPTGITRLFTADMGGQIAWLIPAALLLGAGALWLLRRGDGAAGQRSQLLLWMSWLLVTGLVFSFSKGIIHPYYTVALAPAIGALVGIGAVSLWRVRDQLWSRVVLAVTIAATAVLSHQLLARSPSWHPWLRTVVLLVGLLVAAAALVPPGRFASRLPHAGRALAAAALVLALSGPIAYSLDTASSAASGAIPSAGPTATTAGGPGGLRGFGRPGGNGGQAGGSVGGPPGLGTGGAGRPGLTPPQFGGQLPGGSTGGGGRGGGFGGLGGPGGGAGGGGLLNAGTVNDALRTALKANASSYTWVAAAVGSQIASGFQLAADEPVMAIGGFNGTDPTPTLAQFEKYVAAGKIHYFLGTGPFGGGQGSTDSAAIYTWVKAHFTATTIGGTAVYDLTSPTAGSSSSTTGT